MAEATLVLRAAVWRPGNIDKIIAKSGGAIVKCDPPDDERAEEFCVKRASKRYGVRIEPAAADLLVERIGPDLARLDSELGKLAAMIGDRADGTITRADVAEMVGVSREEQAWAIQDALLTGDPAKALAKLDQLLRIAQVPEQLVVWSMVELSRKVHDAARLFGQGEGEFAIGKTLKLWGPSQSAILGAARRMPAVTAARLLDAALGLDRSVRRGVTMDLPRRLQCFAVELTDSLRR
jgi:DNA polymerase III delta subunit